MRTRVFAALALSIAATAAAQPDLPSFRTWRDVAAAGYPAFTPVSGLAFYEARTGRPVEDDQYAKANDATKNITDERTLQLFNEARGYDEFARREAIQALAPVFSKYRQEAAQAKGLLVHIFSSKGPYDFNLQSFQMEGKPAGGPAQKYYPGGLVCSSGVDSLATTGRDFCIYFNNFNGNGRYRLPLPEQTASRFARLFEQRSIRVFALVEFDGPPQVAQPKSAAAGTQAVRVVALVLLENDGTVFATIPVSDPRLPGLSTAPALNSAAASPAPSTATASSTTTPKSSKLSPVPLKTVSRSGASAPQAKPVVVDVRE